MKFNIFLLMVSLFSSFSMEAKMNSPKDLFVMLVKYKKADGVIYVNGLPYKQFKGSGSLQEQPFYYLFNGENHFHVKINSGSVSFKAYLVPEGKFPSEGITLGEMKDGKDLVINLEKLPELPWNKGKQVDEGDCKKAFEISFKLNELINNKKYHEFATHMISDAVIKNRTVYPDPFVDPKQDPVKSFEREFNNFDKEYALIEANATNTKCHVSKNKKLIQLNIKNYSSFFVAKNTKDNLAPLWNLNYVFFKNEKNQLEIAF